MEHGESYHRLYDMEQSGAGRNSMIRRALVLAVLLLVAPIIGFAETVVDRCGSDNEPGGTNLASALNQGGRIVFHCPSGTEIRMTRGHTVAPNTTIDGGGKVTLDAYGLAMTMFFVPHGSFTAENLKIRNARWRPHSGSVLQAESDVSFSKVSISGSESPVKIRGGALIVDSEFLRNTGWALTIDGEAQVERSRFIGNDTGLSLRSGVVHDSLFSQNKTGALRIDFPQNEVSVIKSNFLANVGRGAILLSQRSGREGNATVSIKRSRFADNVNTNGGGAITIFDSTVEAPTPAVLRALLSLPPASFAFAYNEFIGNHGTTGGAINADLHNTEDLTITGGIFVRNEADDAGGAIAWVGRSILITHSLFRANQSPKGGALFADFREGASRWAMANSLIVENTVGANGGAVEVGPIELFNVTIAKNTGVGFVADVHGSPPDLPVVANTIISENSEGNCRGVAPTSFKGRNLQFGHRDCPGVPFEDPLLDSLYVPALGSSALFLGDVSFCRAAPVSSKDIMFQSRATDNRCALGAFERPPIRRGPRSGRPPHPWCQGPYQSKPKATPKQPRLER
jgi:hypothetical protein